MKPGIHFTLVVLISLLTTACGGNGNTDYFALQIKEGGNSGYSTGWMQAISETPDGGMILAGKRDGDLWVMKFSAQGNVLWDNTYIKTFYVYRGLFPLNGGAFAVIGLQEGNAYYLVLESDGSVRTFKTYPGLWFKEVEKAGNGFYLLGGSDFGGAGLVHIDTAGNMISSSQYTNLDVLRRIMELPNGELIAVGEKGNPYDDNGRVDLALLKLSAQGDLLASRLYGKHRMIFDADGLHVNSNQQIVLLGDMQHGYETAEANTIEPIRLVINNQDLSIQSASKYRFFKESRITDTLATNDGGMLLLGHFGESDYQYAQRHPALVKMDSTGAVQWKKFYKFPQANSTSGAHLLATAKGYLFAGEGYDAYDNFGLAISTDVNGAIPDSSLKIENVNSGTRSSLALTNYSNPVQSEPLVIEPILHQPPLAVPVSSKLTRH